MLQNNPDACYETGRDFWVRLHQFRYLEGLCLEEANDATIADEAWALLGDLERAYSAKSYSACFCLACAMIEIHLRRIVRPKGNNLNNMLKSIGLLDELEWLVELRNAVMHGNPNPFISYFRKPELESEVEQLCQKAFVALHSIAAKTSRNVA